MILSNIMAAIFTLQPLNCPVKGSMGIVLNDMTDTGMTNPQFIQIACYYKKVFALDECTTYCYLRAETFLLELEFSLIIGYFYLPLELGT